MYELFFTQFTISQLSCSVNLKSVPSRSVCTIKGGEGQSNTTVVMLKYIMWY